eukprot:gnl/TRDRNA2_/TRDRNA2_179517_c0_seq1.p1 gnl/TRDRNA2_/TRDRNA2_179517_c0~~gnl/TRDRNA2_/TRDRNA2_179517_c0_seq1.p1  ORF type:complete len:541 (+),score=133.36 gnl/TRDRNA2_/TRDRNA2_179517_c0_seq1:174-1796(+)
MRALLVTLLTVFRLGRSDIPVHCHSKDVEGVWVIRATPSTAERSSCHHRRPDAVVGQPNASVEELTLERQVRLSTAPGAHSTGGDAVSTGDFTGDGSWRMVADEGFEVNFESDVFGFSKKKAKGPLSLFAFNRYVLSGLNGTKDYEKHSVSHCEETILGWYSIGREEYGCWQGKRSDTKPKTRTVMEPVKKKKNARKEQPLSLAQASERVRRINARQGALWQARVYDRWVGKTPAQLAAHRGVHWRRQDISRLSFLAKPVRTIANISASNVDDIEDERRYFADSEEAEKTLPKEVDWRSARGNRSYLEPVMDQEDCGSCWAVSGMRMMTARHKIKQDDPEALPWSITFPLYCSEFNQGCEGGYGYLVAKWSQEVGLLPATCSRYDAHGSCSVNTTCVQELQGQKRWRADKPQYLGGRQHMATEGMLMRELHERGPIVVGLTGGDIGDDFMFYAGGIFTGEEIPPKDKSGGHAVTLVGYGEEDGEKYWLVQNSWGEDWGEDGYVRLSRKVIKFHTGEVTDIVEDEQGGRNVDKVVALKAQA